MSHFCSFKSSSDAASSTPITVITPPKHHEDYYFEDGNLVVQVENTLFRIFRSTLTRHSNVFRDVFSLPKPVISADQIVEGSSDIYPVRFPGISSIDFERLLWILYPPSFDTHKPQTAEEWTSVLHLSTRWEFDSVRRIAIRELERYPLSPVDKITLSREFDIATPWTLKAYTELCERAEALTVQEALALGLQVTVRISQIRERLRRSGTRHMHRPSSPSRPAVKHPDTAFESYRLGGQKDFVLEHLGRSRPRHPRTGHSGKAFRVSDATRMVAEAFGLTGVCGSA